MSYLYLMRHGETLFNAQKRIQGWSDSPLTQQGREQARAAGRCLQGRGVSFDHLYCSTSERASDTLELVLEGMGAPVRPYERVRALKEMNYGSLEGMPEFLNCATPAECVSYYLQFGGESSNDVRDRMVAALTSIMERPGHECVLAVSHSGATYNFLRALQDPTEELAKGWGNCTTCVYRFENGVFTLEEVIRNPGREQVR